MSFSLFLNRCWPFSCCLSVVLQHDKGDYLENLLVLSCPDKQRSFETFTCLDLRKRGLSLSKSTDWPDWHGLCVRSTRTSIHGLCVRPAETRITKVDQADNRSRNSFSKFDINSPLHFLKFYNKKIKKIGRYLCSLQHVGENTFWKRVIKFL